MFRMDSRSFYRALTITLVVGAVAFLASSFGLRDTIHQLSGLLLFVLFSILYFIGPGILSGLLAFIPPLRRSARHTASIRKRLMVAFGLLGFALEFSLLIYGAVSTLV